mmetsp:Transcript_2259/g.7434  ORF Transcript_2259/g.7434 Transcript_2259/m.7434 type:complete len:221 (-) Transcript_2259:900-1562(-)
MPRKILLLFFLSLLLCVVQTQDSGDSDNSNGKGNGKGDGNDDESNEAGDVEDGSGESEEDGSSGKGKGAGASEKATGSSLAGGKGKKMQFGSTEAQILGKSGKITLSGIGSSDNETITVGVKSVCEKVSHTADQSPRRVGRACFLICQLPLVFLPFGVSARRMQTATAWARPDPPLGSTASNPSRPRTAPLATSNRRPCPAWTPSRCRGPRASLRMPSSR